MFVCCKAADAGCGALNDCLCPEDRPSPIFTVFAFIMNVITVILTIVSLVASDSSGTCTNSMVKPWNYGIFAICAVNMTFALYIYIRFTNKIRSGETAGKAANQLFLYDFGVYFYIWFVVFIIVWLILANGWTRGELVCRSLASTGPIVTCLVIYIVLGFFVIMFSMVTECCRSPRWASGERPVVVAQPVPVQQGYAQQQPTSGYQPMPAYAQQPQQQQQPYAHQQQQYAAPANAPPAQNPAYNTGGGGVTGVAATGARKAVGAVSTGLGKLTGGSGNRV